MIQMLLRTRAESKADVLPLQMHGAFSGGQQIRYRNNSFRKIGHHVIALHRLSGKSVLCYNSGSEK